MEKTHKWVYVRAKGNGKKANENEAAAVSTPALSTAAPSHDAPTPGSWISNASAQSRSRVGGLWAGGPGHHPLGVNDGASGQTPAGCLGAGITEVTTTLPAALGGSGVVRPDPSIAAFIRDGLSTVATVPWTSTPATATMAAAATAATAAVTQPNFHAWASMSGGPDAPSNVDGGRLDWADSKVLDTTAPSQLLTPNDSVDWHMIPTDWTQMPQLSPAGQTAFYPPASTGPILGDEGFGDCAAGLQPMDDFALFDSDDPTMPAGTDQGVMFPDLPIVDGGHHQEQQDPGYLTGGLSFLDSNPPPPNLFEDLVESDP